MEGLPGDVLRYIVTFIPRVYRAPLKFVKIFSRAVPSIKLDRRLTYQATSDGNLQLLKWIYSHGYDLSGYAICTISSKHGHLEIIKWGREMKTRDPTLTTQFELSILTGAYAAKSGHLDVLQWLKMNGCPIGVDTCSYAAKNGHLDVLQWLRTNCCPWNEETCANAAGNGHIEILKWAYSNGCPWNTSTCSNLAYNGDLETLKWAHSNGCPWDFETSESAANGGHTGVLLWLIANGCPCVSNGYNYSQYLYERCLLVKDRHLINLASTNPT